MKNYLFNKAYTELDLAEQIVEMVKTHNFSEYEKGMGEVETPEEYERRIVMRIEAFLIDKNTEKLSKISDFLSSCNDKQSEQLAKELKKYFKESEKMPNSRERQLAERTVDFIKDYNFYEFQDLADTSLETLDEQKAALIENEILPQLTNTDLSQTFYLITEVSTYIEDPVGDKDDVSIINKRNADAKQLIADLRDYAADVITEQVLKAKPEIGDKETVKDTLNKNHAELVKELSKIDVSGRSERNSAVDAIERKKIMGNVCEYQHNAEEVRNNQHFNLETNVYNVVSTLTYRNFDEDPNVREDAVVPYEKSDVFSIDNHFSKETNVYAAYISKEDESIAALLIEYGDKKEDLKISLAFDFIASEYLDDKEVDCIIDAYLDRVKELDTPYGKDLADKIIDMTITLPENYGAAVKNKDEREI